MPYQRLKRVSVLSTFDLLGEVTETVSGIDTDWSAGATAVEVAVVPGGATPASGDWKTAIVEIDGTTTPQTRLTKLLVGPAGGALTLTPGSWDHYSRITVGTERPVLQHGSFEAY